MEDTLRELRGRMAAFEALIWAMARTHPDKAALVAAFQENSNIMKTHLLNEPISETYIQGFDKALSQILGRLK